MKLIENAKYKTVRFGDLCYGCVFCHYGSYYMRIGECCATPNLTNLKSVNAVDLIGARATYFLDDVEVLDVSDIAFLVIGEKEKL